MKFCEQVENVQRFLGAYDRLRARAVDEVCFLVVEGHQGYGKTHTIFWWATRNGCPYVRSNPAWTPAGMLREMCSNTWDAHIRPETACRLHGSRRRDVG